MSTPPLSSKKSLLQWTKSMLRKYGVEPKDRYSQSFAVDPVLVRDLVSEAKKISCRDVVEVGSGLGTITYYLSRYSRVLAIEIDPLLAIATKNTAVNSTVVNADALSIEWMMECIVSNTPYTISSDLIVKIARTNTVEKAVLVLQKEVAERLVAKPGTSNYGRITVLVSILFDVSLGRVYPPSSFYPRPKVYSRLLVLKRKKKYNEYVEALENVTRLLFSERRKKAIRVLSKKLGVKEHEARRLGVRSNARVYELDPGVLMEIARFLKERKSL